jgi:hypothetical protein
MGWSGIKDYGFGGKNRTKEEDDEYRSRIGGAPRTRVWTDEKICSFIDELLDVYKKILIDSAKIEEGNPKRLKQETIMDMNTMVNRLLQFKEKYYPPVQKNININIDTTASEVIERLKQWKKKKEVIVINEEPTPQQNN